MARKKWPLEILEARRIPFLSPRFHKAVYFHTIFFFHIMYDGVSKGGTACIQKTIATNIYISCTNILENVIIGSSSRQSMASALPLPVASTKETTNYALLCRLLVDVGTQALRDTFNRIHPPPGLHLILAPSTPEHRKLQSLKSRRIINPTQWGKLYPTIHASVSSASFDVTLLVVLLRNICGLVPPVTGWDNLPSAADTSTEANIARVKFYRNTVYGHVIQASVDDATFNNHWRDISNALVALGGASYGAAISKLKYECMDPDTEKHYKDLLLQWKKDEDNIKEKLEEMEGM